MASVLMATLVATGQQLHMAYLDWRIGALTQPEIRFAGIVVAFAFLLTKVVTPVSSRVVDSLVVYRHGFLGQPGECIHAAVVSANARRTTAGARKPSRSINHCWL